MLHQLQANIQFSAIGKIKDQLKLDLKQILMVMDHKQKVLPMKYQEGQVEYFGKKGMRLLGFMVVNHYPSNSCIG
eukprot:5940772-Ditylum_brightwellii.AAC.1